jgi:hypothetical protein
MDKKIADYIKKQKSPQKEILLKLRKIFLQNLLQGQEKMQWGVITFKDGKFYLASLKDKVNVGFSIKGLDKKEVSFFEGNGKTMKHIKIHSLQDIDKKKLVKLIKLVAKMASCQHC